MQIVRPGGANKELHVEAFAELRQEDVASSHVADMVEPHEFDRVLPDIFQQSVVRCAASGLWMTLASPLARYPQSDGVSV